MELLESARGLKRLAVDLLDCFFVSLFCRHLLGPKSIPRSQDDCVVLALMRDEELQIRDFIEHHLAMGFQHIYLLDNGSKDRTLDICGEYPSVSVYHCSLPYGKHKYRMRKFITRKFSMNRWCVMPDIDELFYYPNHKLVSLKEFLRYLNKGKYNAVLTQMLDMYFGRTLKDIKEGLESRSMSIESHRSFEVDSIDRRPIPKGLKNKISNSSLKLFYGGFRKRVFNVNPCLSKFALFKPGHPTYRVGQHLVTRATIADVSCALLHYKFTGGFEAKLESALAEENYYKGSLEYKQYSSTLKADADIVIHTDSTLRLDNFKILEDVEFWVLSQAYIDYCAAQKSSATS